MKKYIVHIGFVLCFIILIKTIVVFQEYSELDGALDMVNERVEHMSKEIKQIEELDTKPLLNMEDAFMKLVNEKNLISTYFDIDISMNIPNSAFKENINNYVKDSKFEGVRELDVIIVLNNVENDSNTALLLDIFFKIESSTGFYINEIMRTNMDITLKGKLYGV